MRRWNISNEFQSPFLGRGRCTFLVLDISQDLVAFI